MCYVCSEWAANARDVWRRVFEQVDRCGRLVERMPLRDQAARIHGSMPGYPFLVELEIGLSQGSCGLIWPAIWPQTQAARARLIASGEEWLEVATSVADEWEACLAAQAQAAAAAAQAQATATLMAELGRITRITDRTIQAVEAGQRASWERDVLLRSGPPFYEVWNPQGFV
jgi:hypothetical protein